MVLPEAVLFQRYNEPYDRSWFETLSADPAKLDEWNRMTSRWKLVDLVSKGAVVEGDEFEIAVVAANGEKMDRYVKVCRYLMICYRQFDLPRVWLIRCFPHRLSALNLERRRTAPRSACPRCYVAIHRAKKLLSRVRST